MVKTMISLNKTNYVEHLEDIRKMFESVPRSVGRLTACSEEVVILTIEVKGGYISVFIDRKGIDIYTPFGDVKTPTLTIGVSHHEGVSWIDMFLVSGMSQRGALHSIRGE